MIDARTFTHKHYLQFVPIGVVIDKVCDLAIEWVRLNRQVNGYLFLELDDVVFERSVLELHITHHFESIQAALIRIIHALLEPLHVLAHAKLLLLKPVARFGDFGELHGHCCVFILELVDCFQVLPDEPHEGGF